MVWRTKNLPIPEYILILEYPKRTRPQSALAPVWKNSNGGHLKQGESLLAGNSYKGDGGGWGRYITFYVQYTVELR